MGLAPQIWPPPPSPAPRKKMAPRETFTHRVAFHDATPGVRASRFGPPALAVPREL
jgi:hypothetical protein